MRLAPGRERVDEYQAGHVTRILIRIDEGQSAAPGAADERHLAKFEVPSHRVEIRHMVSEPEPGSAVHGGGVPRASLIVADEDIVAPESPEGAKKSAAPAAAGPAVDQH